MNTVRIAMDRSSDTVDHTPALMCFSICSVMRPMPSLKKIAFSLVVENAIFWLSERGKFFFNSRR